GDAQRDVADAADDAAELRGAVPAEPAAGHVHGRAPALPRGVLGAVLPAAAVLRSRSGHRVQGAAGPELRPLARLRPGPAASGLAGLAQLRLLHRDHGDLVVVRTLPLAALPGRRAADPHLDVRGGDARRGRAGAPVLQ